VTIVVPVFGAPLQTKACLDALAASKDEVPDVKVLVIDDATPDERLVASLYDQCRHHGFEVVRNAKNLGFVGTCNRAFEMLKHGHVLLLNSDTVVFPGWLKEMVAGVGDGVASVTAVSNNASIYSLPSPGIDPFSVDLTSADLAEIVRSAWKHEAISVPTAVGFCMLLTRAALDAIGGFDPRYGKGYAEEDDWCMRARLRGFSHRLAPRAFVYHEGGVSMAMAGVTEEGQSDRAENLALLESLHPDYWKLFHEFLAEPDIHMLRLDVSAALLQLLRNRRPLILHWLDADPFGQPGAAAQEMIDGLAREYLALVAHRSTDGYLELSWRANDIVMHRSLETSAAIFTDRPSLAWERLADKILEIERPDVLHVHSGHRPGMAVLRAAQRRGTPVVVSTGGPEDPHPIADEVLARPGVVVATDPSVHGLRGLYDRLVNSGQGSK
jgi:GT2 family glycosyltransferase